MSGTLGRSRAQTHAQGCIEVLNRYRFGSRDNSIDNEASNLLTMSSTSTAFSATS
jgi:hypothetical protein